VLDLGNSKSGGLDRVHNLSVMARLLLNRGFNSVGLCNFKELRVAEIAHLTTVARLIVIRRGVRTPIGIISP